MQCSQSRNQPGCFSGRTSPPPSVPYNSRSSSSKACGYTAERLLFATISELQLASLSARVTCRANTARAETPTFVRERPFKDSKGSPSSAVMELSPIEPPPLIPKPKTRKERRQRPRKERSSPRSINGQRTVRPVNGKDKETFSSPANDQIQEIRQQILAAIDGEMSLSKLQELDVALASVARTANTQQLLNLLSVATKSQRPLYKGIIGLLTVLLERDPSLESVQVMPMLKMCSRVNIRHDGFFNTISKSIARQLPVIKLEDALLWLDALAALTFQMQDSTKLSLERAVEILLTSSQLEITAHTEDVTKIARAMRRLGLRPPRSWLRQMMEVLTTRIEVLVMVAEGRSGMEGQTVREVAACVLCLGHLQHPIPNPKPLFEAITYACGSGDENDLVCIARGIQRLHRIVKVPRFVWNALDRCSAELLTTLSDQDICRVLHSFGKCQVRPRKLLPLVTAQVVVRSDGLTLHQVSILLWSFAMLSRCTPVSDGATAALVAQASRLIQLRTYIEGKQHTVDMANIAWAVVTLKHDAHNIAAFVERVMKCCRPIQAMSGTSLAIMLWACGKCSAEPYQVPLYMVRTGELVKELDSFQLTTILWAYAKLNAYPGIELTESLLAALTVKVPSTQTQGIGDAIWACGRLGHHPGTLVAVVLADLHKRGAEYIMEAWSAIIWGLTQVGEDTAQFLQLAHHMIDEKRVRFDVRLISTILWSAAVFEHFKAPVYKRMMGLLYTFSEESLDRTSKNHVREAHLLATLVGEYREQDLSPMFGMGGRMEYWKARLMHQDLGRQTLIQLATVREALRNLQIPYIAYYPLSQTAGTSSMVLREDIILEHPWDPSKGLKQDIMIDRPWGRNRRVAVEFLSPSMLTVNTQQPKWRSRYRAACLCAMGFDVLWLPYSEWDAAMAKNRQEEFLYSRIHRLLGTVL